MLAIFKREFKSYFQNVIGWLFVAALLAVYGLYFYVYNLKNGYPYISCLLYTSFMMVPVEGSEKKLPAELVLIAAGFLGTESYVAKAFWSFFRMGCRCAEIR